MIEQSSLRHLEIGRYPSIRANARRSLHNGTRSAPLPTRSGCSLAAARHRQLLRADRRRSARGKALIAITLDLEMSRNFPVWDDMHWDYEKGNLNDETKHTRSRPAAASRRRGASRTASRSAGSSSRRTSTGSRDRAGRPPRRQPHLRPRQRAGDAARGHPVSLPARAVADRGPNSRRR